MNKFPVCFIGHGSPMNAIEENEFTLTWKKIASLIPKPKAIVCISAHYLKKGVFITSSNEPKIVYDFFGFPDELYFTDYKVQGSDSLASEISEKIKFTNIELDPLCGFDHGTWSVLKQMFPNPDFPILQLSLNVMKPMDWHSEFAKSLSVLRKEGILIIGSGNIVHNLGLLNFQRMSEQLDWAIEFDLYIQKNISERKMENLLNPTHKYFNKSVPTLDHYLPMIYIASMLEKEERVQFFNSKTLSSISMTSFISSFDV